VVGKNIFPKWWFNRDLEWYNVKKNQPKKTTPRNGLTWSDKTLLTGVITQFYN